MEIENIDLTKLTPDIRRLNDMRKVLHDEVFAKDAKDADLYLMYRKVKVEGGLNHNITITKGAMLGDEFNKTKGHIHIGDFQEIYTVLKGQAIFFMQKGDGEKIEDAYAVMAKEGESAIIPAGYGHITINPSASEDLITGDWSSAKCKSDYSMVESLKGGCYYYIFQPQSGNGIWIKNENYKSVPQLRFEEPLKEIPQNLDFLK